MGRRISPLEAAKDARLLLDQAILLLDSASVNLPAAHADLARHSLNEWIYIHESSQKPMAGLDATNMPIRR